jgi:hypothetical protein
MSRLGIRATIATISLIAVAACSGGGAGGSPAPAPSTTAAPATSVAPVATAAPATSPPATPAPTTAAANACDQTYYPLRLGATWTTNNGPGQTIPSTVTKVLGDAKHGIAKVENKNPSGSTFTVDILCGPGMAYGDALYVGADGKQGTRKRTGGDGVFLPPDADLVEGHKFSWTMIGAFDMPSYDSKGNFVAQIQYTVELSEDCTVSGPKSVTLATGEQSGFQITCTGTHKSTDSTGKVFETPNPIDLYYLKGVGPSGVAAGTELVSYSIP